MMRGMFSAISGLRVHQLLLDVTANNIANVNTVGYKASANAFSTLLASAVGSGDVSQAGVIANQAQHVTDQGGITSTQSPTDLALSGNGFFVVSPTLKSNTVKAQSLLYTRAGSLAGLSVFSCSRSGSSSLSTPDTRRC